MQLLEVSSVVRLIYRSLGVKRLIMWCQGMDLFQLHISKQTGNFLTTSANISIPRRTVHWSLVKGTLL